jgi:hypothetical protein
MGTIGDPYNNAVIESFWARMQTELLDRQAGGSALSSPTQSLSTWRSSTTATTPQRLRLVHLVECENLHATDVACLAHIPRSPNGGPDQSPQLGDRHSVLPGTSWPGRVPAFSRSAPGVRFGWVDGPAP